MATAAHENPARDALGPATGFLDQPPVTADVQALYDEDRDGNGYVMNLSRVWAHHPAAHDMLFELVTAVGRAGGLTQRQRGVLVAATAATLGDSYCALAWGGKLSRAAGPELAATVLRGEEPAEREDRVLARWARRVAQDPSATTRDDVQELRDAGFSDEQIFAVTAYVALRIAFSTVNDALGARPDRQLLEVADEVRDAVTFGRPPAPA
jgi:uncharacterized peroxidase-related enzyme